MKINELREIRAAKLEEQKALLAGDFNAEAEAKFDAINAEVDSYEKQIKHHEDLAAREAAQKSIADGIDNNLVKGKSKATELEAFAKLLSGGQQAMSAADWDAMRNTQVTTSAAPGGITVPTTTMAYVTEALKAFGGARSLGRVINTSSGETMVWPTADFTAEMGERVAEDTTASTLDTAFGSVNSTVHVYSSKSIPVSRQLLQDSAINVVSHVLSVIASRLARVQNLDFTLGTAVNQPQGYVTAAASTVTAASSAAITLDNIIDLYHSLDPAYRMGAKWAMNDQLVATLRKLKDTTGRPLLIGDDIGTFDLPGQIGTIFGRPVVVNQDMVKGAAAKAIVFGNFDNFLIRDVPFVSVEVFTDSVYSLKNTVGYVGWMRSGSVNTGINNIKCLTTTAA